MRDRSIDVGRGLLVLLMLYGHTLQFFGWGDVFPVVNVLEDIINLLVFPSFVFFFGATTHLAYLSKPYRKALPRMAMTFARTLCAFWLSGIAFRVLRENKPFAVGYVRRVLLLQDIPGWSEFLIAFALYALLTMVAFHGLRKVGEKPWLGLIVGGVALGCTFLPYDKVNSTYLSLLIGGTDFAYFPIVQYLPYFLAGIAYAAGGRRVRLCLAGVGVAGTGAGVLWMALNGWTLPGRFPPHWAWIVLPGAGVALLTVLCRLCCRVKGRGEKWLVGPILRGLSHVGGRSLYYLLGSNLILFTVAGKGIAPDLANKSIFPWTLLIQSPTGALGWCGVMVLALAFVASLAGRGAGKRKGESI